MVHAWHAQRRGSFLLNWPALRHRLKAASRQPGTEHFKPGRDCPARESANTRFDVLCGPINPNGITRGRHAGIPSDHHRHRTSRTGLGAATGGCRLEGGDHRAQAFRRNLRQYRLHPDQDAGRKRLCGARCTPCRRLRREHRREGHRRYEGGQGAQGRHCERIAQWRRTVAEDAERLHGVRGPRPIRRAERSGDRRCGAQSR